MDSLIERSQRSYPRRRRAEGRTCGTSCCWGRGWDARRGHGRSTPGFPAAAAAAHDLEPALAMARCAAYDRVGGSVVPEESADGGSRPSGPAEVEVGRYVLTVGDPAGTRLETAPTEGQVDTEALRRGIEQGEKEAERPGGVAAGAGELVDKASDVTSQVERALD